MTFLLLVDAIFNQSCKQRVDFCISWSHVPSKCFFLGSPSTYTKNLILALTGKTGKWQQCNTSLGVLIRTYLHFLSQSVQSENIKLFVWVLFEVFVDPSGFTTTWQPNHHDHFALIAFGNPENNDEIEINNQKTSKKILTHAVQLTILPILQL